MKKMKQIMKDEEGLTLVELLAVVVIMAIIAGIAAVAISKVIQRTREDAQVANVQQMIASANLYDIQEEHGLAADTKLSELKTKGTIKSVEFAKDKDKNSSADAITFSKEKASGEIYVNIPAGSLMAGQKGNKLEKVSEDVSASLTRDDLFGTPAGSESK